MKETNEKRLIRLIKKEFKGITLINATIDELESLYYHIRNLKYRIKGE